MDDHPYRCESVARARESTKGQDRSGLVKQRLPRFLLVGAYNTVAGYVFFVLVAAVAGDYLHHQAILAIAFAISVVHAYASQRFLVFRSSGPVVAEFGRFLIVSLGVLLLNGVLLELLIGTGAGLLSAQAIATLATTVVTFVAHSMWSFVSKR